MEDRYTIGRFFLSWLEVRGNLALGEGRKTREALEWPGLWVLSEGGAGGGAPLPLLVRARDRPPKGCPERTTQPPAFCSFNPLWRRARLWAADLLGCGSASLRRQHPPAPHRPGKFTEPDSPWGGRRLLSQVPEWGQSGQFRRAFPKSDST